MDEFDDFDEPPPCREGGSRPFDYFCSYSYAAHAVWKLNDLGVRFAFEASMLSKDAGAAAEWAALAFKRLQSLHLHGEAGDMAEKHLRDYVVWRLAATLLRRPQGGAWHALTWSAYSTLTRVGSDPTRMSRGPRTRRSAARGVRDDGAIDVWPGLSRASPAVQPFSLTERGALGMQLLAPKWPNSGGVPLGPRPRACRGSPPAPPDLPGNGFRHSS